VSGFVEASAQSTMAEQMSKREFLPDAPITFDNETGGRERSGNFMIDNSRVVTEFGMQFRPYRERVLQIINEVRAKEGKPPITAP
jgi:predicted N-formylglutamate amidohydrolase